MFVKLFSIFVFFFCVNIVFAQNTNPFMPDKNANVQDACSAENDSCSVSVNEQADLFGNTGIFAEDAEPVKKETSQKKTIVVILAVVGLIVVVFMVNFLKRRRKK
jgi:hypothetical protein